MNASFEIPTIEVILEGTFLLLSSITGVCANGLVLMLVARRKNLRKPLHILVASLASTDLMTSLIFTSTTAYGVIGEEWKLGQFLCVLQFMVYGQNLCVSIVNNFVVSLYCYSRCVRNPHSDWSRKRVLQVVLGVWIYGFIILNVPVVIGLIPTIFYLPYASCTISPETPEAIAYAYVICGYIFCVYLPIALSCACYIAIFISIRKRVFATNSGQASAHARRVRSTKNMFIIYLLFCACFFPDGMKSFFDPMGTILPLYATRIVFFLNLLNPALNPIFYMSKLAEFRTELRKILRLPVVQEEVTQTQTQMSNLSRVNNEGSTAPATPKVGVPANNGSSSLDPQGSSSAP